MVLGTVSQVFSQIETSDSVQIYVKAIPLKEKQRLDGIYPVKKEGGVNMPFIGIIVAAGKTVEQFAQDLEKAYATAEIYPNAKFQVIVPRPCGIKTPLFFVGGEVKVTGGFVLEEKMTLVGAIEAAGGLTELGDLKSVNIYRSGDVNSYDLTRKEDRETLLEIMDTIEVVKQIARSE